MYVVYVNMFSTNTLPKFNIAPDKWWLEDYFPIEEGTVQGRTVKFRRGIQIMKANRKTYHTGMSMVLNYNPNISSL